MTMKAIQAFLIIALIWFCVPMTVSATSTDQVKEESIKIVGYVTTFATDVIERIKEIKNGDPMKPHEQSIALYGGLVLAVMIGFIIFMRRFR